MLLLCLFPLPLLLLLPMEVAAAIFDVRLSTSKIMCDSQDRTPYSAKVRHLIVGDLTTLDCAIIAMKLSLLWSSQSRLFAVNSSSISFNGSLSLKIAYLQQDPAINLSRFFKLKVISSCSLAIKSIAILYQ